MSVRVLAVDTTSELGSIALVEDERLIEEVALQSPDGFGHVLFGEIERLLARHGIALDELDCFAAASGPGSFTGVRVGLTAVKGLAEATGRKAVAVSNLEALASFGTRELRAVMIDAHRGEIYGAVYNVALELVQEEVVTKLAEWKATLPSGDLELIEGRRTLAGAIGRIAASRFARGLAQDPAGIDANYVRRSDAELLWKESQ